MAHLEGRTKHTFRMPLQSHDKGSGRQFNGFNGSVGRYGGGDKSFAQILKDLLVKAVDKKIGPRDFIQDTSFGAGDLVADL